MASSRKDSPGGDEIAAGVKRNLPQVEFHPHTVEVVDHPAGYREFRCLPATWSYPEARPIGPFLTEFYSARTGTDPYGIGLESEFWSGSDAALRLRALPPDDLALRELAALASRRSVGLNAPKPWTSRHEVEEIARTWEPEATDVYFSEHPDEDKPGYIWAQYGMEESDLAPVIFSYGRRSSLRPPLGRAGSAWAGGPGTWYAWSTLLGWDRWPRRQEAQPCAAAADPGKLLLFISHRWESLEHPDPTGAQLLCLKVGLTLALAAAVLRLGNEQKGAKTFTTSGLPEVIAEFLGCVLGPGEVAALQPWAKAIKSSTRRVKREKTFWAKARQLETPEVQPLLDRVRELLLVWYDYASMLQAPRSRDEETAFRREILELNTIQSHAVTLVMAGDRQYLSRAWCFLELCGGMRQRICELTPSWGTTVGVGHSATAWANRSDQLIAALHALGPEAICNSGLEATHPEDLASIAHLLSRLALTAVIETDDSDLIGGVLPIPFRSGEWMLPDGLYELSATHEYALPSPPDSGRVLATDILRQVAEQHAGADTLDGVVGMWIYATQRLLTLSWAGRAGEFWETVKTALASRQECSQLQEALRCGKDPSVACMWADAWSLAEDGLGWTRPIPSTVRLLVIITQVDLPELCLIYHWVVRAHLACSVPVVVYAPETGRTLLYLPGGGADLHAVGRRLDVLAVPRIRRPDARPSRMFLAGGVPRNDVEVLAALRLDPAQGLVPPGQVCKEAAEEGFGRAGEEITVAQLLGHSKARVRAEGLARATAATWDEWCAPRVNQGYWQIGMAPLQIRIIEQLVSKISAVFENPFKCRRSLRLLVEDHEGYALPPWILEEADAFLEMIAEENATGES